MAPFAKEKTDKGNFMRKKLWREEWKKYEKVRDTL